jgi:ABC-type glycerol-3-phosphate transport system substrate-binding protein
LQWTSFVPEADEFLEAKAQEWGSANNVTVSVERINQNDIDARLAASVQAGSGPDIVQHYFNWPWRFAEQLVDVGDIAKELDSSLGGIHAVPKTYAEVEGSNNRAFLAQQLSSTLNGASIYFSAKKQFPELEPDLDVFPMPAGPAGQFSMHLILTRGIMSYSQNQSAAKEFIAWYMQPEQYNQYIETNGGYVVGPFKQYDNHPIWETDPRVRTYRDGILSEGAKWPGYPGPPTRASSTALSRYTVINMFAKAASREFEPQGAVDWAKGQLEGIYNPQ